MIEIHEGEAVIAELRRHWFVFVAQAAFLVAFVAAPVLAVFLLEQLAGFVLDPNHEALVIFFSAAWLLLSWIIFFIMWTNFYLDAWFVTDQRIVDIEQWGLFNRQVSECRLDRIQDVTVDVDGIVPTALRFGDVHVQTAGEAREFLLGNVPDPYAVKDIIFRAQDAALRRARNADESLETGH
jgi:uncharacterized membrane protein YdbT with pleckstrin-like domain